MTINTPGAYRLTHDIINNSETCLIISDTKNVSLDCQGNMVTGMPSFYINNSSNVSIKSCIFNSLQGGVGIDASEKINFTKNIFNPTNLLYYNILINDTTNVSLTQNKINAPYQQNFSSGAVIKNNVFIAPQADVQWPSALITFNYGSGNKALNNIIDGNASGNNGADDGILTVDESNDTISNNTIKNVWDCGIETLGLVENSTFSNNTITHAPVCGIGGWYWNSLKNNIFSNNVIDDSNLMFDFSRTYGLRPEREEAGHIVPADTTLYFSDNTFTGNVFLHPRITGTQFVYSSYFNINSVGVYNILPGEQVIDETNMILDNNIFKNNNFGDGIAPLFWPLSLGVIDGGGNECGSVLSLEPYIYALGEYPIDCQ